ncbi:MAG TPA: polysaccharide deacetylase family protein [Burkholderiaceae bacterium]|nr:polysaccharide deacetylase family protein [Burkholderiaceae bacterium]
MKPVRAARAALVAASLAFALPTGTAWAGEEAAASPPPNSEQVGIVVDDRIGQHVLLDAWTRAAAEQGLPAAVVTDTAIEDDWFHGRSRFRALVLPDGLLRFAGPAFISGLYAFVERGGSVLVVFDAASLGSDGFYAPVRSRLSALVGIDYALYDSLRSETFRLGPVFASERSVILLGIPPGKAVPAAGLSPPFSMQLATYDYAQLIYPSFTTRGRYDGEPLLAGPSGQVVAGMRQHGRGHVIFANLPLGDLKLRTDSWLLNRFLRLLALEAGVPTLAMSPAAIGGLVLNVHVDSSAALPPMRALAASRFFDDGPFSIHVTAGPDLNEPGDKLGVDVEHNADFRQLLRTLAERGHEIGSHGGWIHNYWAAHVGDTESDAADEMLARNQDVLADAIGAPIRVYSAPAGVHPSWVTRWLRQHRMVAYYTTANSGSAPTRTFRDGVLEDQGIWSFPISTLGAAASFEDAAASGLDEAHVVAPWLDALTRFAADEHEIRLVYFHPTGTHLYEEAIASWTATARALQRANRFRWYTMADLARFFDRREAVRWFLVRHGDDDRIEATNAATLRDCSWLLPAATYARPRLVEGSATVRREGADWIITADDETRLVFDTTRRFAPLQED